MTRRVETITWALAVAMALTGCKGDDDGKGKRERRKKREATEEPAPVVAAQTEPPKAAPAQAAPAPSECAPWMKAVTDGKESATIIATLASKRCAGAPEALEARFPTTTHRRAVIDALFAFPSSPGGAVVVEAALADPALAPRALELGKHWKLPGLPVAAVVAAPAVADEQEDEAKKKALADKKAVAVALPPNMGFKGMGTPPGGFGRIHGTGKIDTGGGTGMHARLGRKRLKKVGKIRIGTGASTGFCKKGDVARAVRRQANKIRKCYEQRLQKKPNLRGKLTVRWTIGLNGRVPKAAATGNTLGDGAVTGCILRVIRKLQFPKPEGGICIVQWPFVFNPGG